MTTAIDAINKGGAWRYITKPWDDNELLMAVKNAIETYRITRENIYLTQLTIKQNQELQKWSTELVDVCPAADNGSDKTEPGTHSAQ